jgi:hypothetical protein
VILVVVVVGVTIAVLLPEKASPPSTSGPPRGSQPVVQPTHQVRLTAADRRKIDRVLDRFLPAVMERRNMALGWTLAGPELRGAQTRTQWLAGSTPVPDYQAKETRFHGWQVVALEPQDVIFNIVLHPAKGETEPSTEFSGMVLRRGKDWVVNRLYTIATFGFTKTTSEVGPADFGALGGRVPTPSKQNTGAIGTIGLLPVIGLVGLVLLIPAGLAVGAVMRRRKFRLASARSSSELPPLPRRDRS